MKQFYKIFVMLLIVGFSLFNSAAQIMAMENQTKLIIDVENLEATTQLEGSILVKVKDSKGTQESGSKL